MLLLACLMMLVVVGGAAGFDRVPRPQFQSDYQVPETQHPAPRRAVWEYLDMAALAAALAAATYIAYRARSRRAMSWLVIASLAYFGFVRRGCVCSIGSLQNVSFAVGGGGYALPVTVAVFFLLPLIAALLFGRVFCSSVCPLGAVQDIVALRPQPVPRWLSAPLRFVPVIYLGLAVLFAWTGSDFIICRYDPFVGIFRLGAPTSMAVLGAVLLIAGVVVARPYCRFLCPYGVLLGWLSRLSYRRISTTPDECVTCGLCINSCPVDAIDPPEPGIPSRNRPAERRRLFRLILLLPLFLGIGTGLGWFAAPGLASLHRDVRLVRRLEIEAADPSLEWSLESETFRASTRTREELDTSAAAVLRRFQRGSPILGIFLAVVLFCRLIASFSYAPSTVYRPDPSRCVACTRCYDSCPREHLRRGTGSRPGRGATSARKTT
jgi:ferredoxin